MIRLFSLPDGRCRPARDGADAGTRLGLLLATALNTWLTGPPVLPPLLIPPMSASAVLLFDVPTSSLDLLGRPLAAML